MEPFSFSIPQRILSGAGSLQKLPELVKKSGAAKAFIISGPHLAKMGKVKACQDELARHDISSDSFTETEANPSTETVEKAAEAFRKSHADVIVALGGGSPMDVAKAAAVLASYGGNAADYEGAGKVPGAVVPMIAVPTTAGTGSEATMFSVITDHSRNYKLTIADEHILPDYVILDAELIESVPARTAAACGVDALVHALEAYVSRAASPVSDLLALGALQKIEKNIRVYTADRSNKEAAEEMLLGSTLAGIAFSHARLGNVHAMSHPVSAFFNVPHGVANAILLPAVVEFNAPADTGKYYDIYRCLAKDPAAEADFTPEMLVDELVSLNQELGIPGSLSEVGVREEMLEAMAEDAMKSGNIAVNPRKTTKEDVMELYRKCL